MSNTLSTRSSGGFLIHHSIEFGDGLYCRDKYLEISFAHNYHALDLSLFQLGLTRKLQAAWAL